MGIYVWGTGCGASELIEQGLALSRIAAFVDNHPWGPEFLGKPVISPQALPIDSAQLIIVTTRHAEAVQQQCIDLGIPAEKLLFLKNNTVTQDRNAHCAAAPSLLGEDLLNKLLPRPRIIPIPASLRHSSLAEQDLAGDYVRLATLELLCRRLEAVPGAAAELGVYKGFFARCINALLPERKLYLFDSFQGFDPDAGASQAFQAAHENTALSQVLAIQPHPEQIIPKPGFFPGSAEGLEERFCLVSLDVDFGQATLDGLRYFWPRLERGGYLLLHDFWNPKLPEVAQALSRYERELGQPLPGVPLCDTGGTLVLCK